MRTMRKSKFKYQVGQSVRFKFYDGSIHNGVIVQRGYRNEDTEYLDTQYNQPMYTCHSSDRSGRYPRGYMVYPSLTQNMIQHELNHPHIIKRLDEVPINEYSSHGTGNFNDEVTPSVNSITDRLEQYNDSVDEVEVEETLDSAIQRQKKFLNR